MLSTKTSDSSYGDNRSEQTVLLEE